MTHLRVRRGAGAPADTPADVIVSARHLGGGYVNPDGLVGFGGSLYAATMDHLLVRPKADDDAPWTPKTAAAPRPD